MEREIREENILRIMEQQNVSRAVAEIVADAGHRLEEMRAQKAVLDKFNRIVDRLNSQHDLTYDEEITFLQVSAMAGIRVATRDVELAVEYRLHYSYPDREVEPKQLKTDWDSDFKKLRDRIDINKALIGPAWVDKIEQRHVVRTTPVEIDEDWVGQS